MPRISLPQVMAPRDDRRGHQGERGKVREAGKHTCGQRHAAGALQIVMAVGTLQAHLIRLGDARERRVDVEALRDHGEENPGAGTSAAEQVAEYHRHKQYHRAGAVHFAIEEPAEGTEEDRPAPGAARPRSIAGAHLVVHVDVDMGVRPEEGRKFGANAILIRRVELRRTLPAPRWLAQPRHSRAWSNMIERTGHRSLPSAVSVKAAPPPAGPHEPPQIVRICALLDSISHADQQKAELIVQYLSNVAPWLGGQAPNSCADISPA